MRLLTLAAAATLGSAAPLAVLAHGPEGHAPGASPVESLPWRWTLDPLVLVPLLLAGLVYAVGARRLWREAGRGKGIRGWEAASYCLGIVSLAVALLSPLDAASDLLMSAHMAQHELLMLVAPPLLVLGRPHLAGLFALPASPRARVAEAVRGEPLRSAWSRLTAPLTVMLVHGVAIWIWHVPAFFEAALGSEPVHAVQHASFFFTALLFWWAMARGRWGRAGYGIAVLYVFATATHTSVLGALLTYAGRTWYGTYGARSGAAGVDALQDQQLAGLIMWVPSSVAFLLLGLGLFAAWLGELERRGSPSGPSLRGGRAARSASLLLLAGAALAVIGCRNEAEQEARVLTGGDPGRGREAIAARGCGTCHSIPGVPGAAGSVGPPLAGIAMRTYLAGRLPNSAENMVRWIRAPRGVDPQTAMPDLGIPEGEARDIAAYLFTLRERP